MSNLSTSLYVLFKIDGGCACCAPEPRETVLPEGWQERSGMSLPEILAFAHNVDPSRIDVMRKGEVW